MVQITAINLVGGTQHEHISEVKWRNPNTNTTGESLRDQMIIYIEGGNRAYVTDGRNTADVGVVKAAPPYIRTYADGKWTDNLLALPRY